AVKLLVFLEHHADALTKASLGVLARARQLDAGAAGVVAGANVRALAEQAGGTVFVADDPRLQAPPPRPRGDLPAKRVADERVAAVLLAQSVLAADVAAALAARLDAGLNWDLVELELRDGALVGTQPALGDSVYVETGWTSTPALASFRAGTFEPAEAEG